MDNTQATMEVTIDIQDIYSWRATYSDGDHLDETHAVGGFGSVDLERCTALTLLYMETVSVHTVAVPPGAHPVFFRRRSVSLNPLDGNRELRPTVHCIGWKQGEQAVYLFVREDGSTLLSSDLQAV
jgi:hypothetical protein